MLVKLSGASFLRFLAASSPVFPHSWKMPISVLSACIYVITCDRDSLLFIGCRCLLCVRMRRPVLFPLVDMLSPIHSAVPVSSLTSSSMSSSSDSSCLSSDSSACRVSVAVGVGDPPT